MPLQSNWYCVVYLSDGGMHYRYRCTAKTKRSAIAQCKRVMGVTEIVDAYIEH